MANIQIRLDHTLKAEAQAVPSSMGIDLSAAIRIFLTQMVKENGLPFRPSNDPFLFRENQEALRTSLKDLQDRLLTTKSLDEFRSME